MTRGKTAELAERLAAAVFAERPAYAAPPVDVEGLARELGIESITGARMVEDGRLEQRGGRSWMLVRDDVRTARRRFTVAHELGHLLLADPKRGSTVKSGSVTPLRRPFSCREHGQLSALEANQRRLRPCENWRMPVEPLLPPLSSVFGSFSIGLPPCCTGDNTSRDGDLLQRQVFREGFA